MHDITVVIPTLNTRDDYLRSALDSISGQTRLPNEVIIVNNGLGNVCLPEFHVPIRNFKAVYKAGVAQARNIGVSLAGCEYVAFLDDDDLWSPDYIALMIEKIRLEEPDCLIARLDQLVDGKISPFKNAHGNVDTKTMFIRNPGITGSSVVVRKESFIRAGGYDPKLPPSEDKALILEFLKKGFKVTTVPECRAILRQHDLYDRLTESGRMMEGIFQFYRKYKLEMKVYQRLFNLKKINKHLWLSQKSLKGFCFAGLYELALIPLKYFVKKDKE